MRRKYTIGRWTAELYQRAIYAYRGPDPCCVECLGFGGIEVGGIEVGGTVGEHGDVTADPETVLCRCWNPDGIRIPLWRRPRRQYATGAPF